MWMLFWENGGGGGEEVGLDSHGHKWALLPGSEYTVGRTGSNITPGCEDNTVQKTEHALIRVFMKENAKKDDRPEVLLEDCGSRYGTFINKPTPKDKQLSKEDVTRLKRQETVERRQMSKPTSLKEGDVVQFGLDRFVVRLRWIQLVVISSMLNKEQAKEVTGYLKQCGCPNGISKSWTSTTTHLVMDLIRLSPKVLNCLAAAVPIVTPKFFRDFVSALKSKQRIPEPENYLPEVADTDSEIMLRQPDVDLRVNIGRRTFLAGVTFVLMTEKQRKEVHEAVTLAGGTTLTWNGQPQINLDSDDVVVLKPKGMTDVAKPLWNDVTVTLAKVGRQVVSVTSLYMSLVHCDRAKCNNLKTRCTVLPPSGGGLSQTSYNTIMAPNSLSVNQDSWSGSSSGSQSQRTSNPVPFLPFLPDQPTNLPATTTSTNLSSTKSSNTASVFQQQLRHCKPTTPPSQRAGNDTADSAKDTVILEGSLKVPSPLANANLRRVTNVSTSSMATGPPPSFANSVAAGGGKITSPPVFKSPADNMPRVRAAANESIQISGNVTGVSRMGGSMAETQRSGEMKAAAASAGNGKSQQAEVDLAAVNTQNISQEFKPSRSMTSTQQKRFLSSSSDDEGQTSNKRPAIDGSQTFENSQFSTIHSKSAKPVAEADDFGSDDDDDLFGFGELTSAKVPPTSSSSASQKRKAAGLDDETFDDNDDDLFGFDENVVVAPTPVVKRAKMSTQIGCGTAPTFDNALSAVKDKRPKDNNGDLQPTYSPSGKSTQDKEDEVELKTDPEEYEATLAAGVANSTISDNRTNPSFFPTQGFLRKTKVKLEETAQKYYTIIVKDLFRPELSDRTRNEMTVSRNTTSGANMTATGVNTTSIVGRKTFKKQYVRKPAFKINLKVPPKNYKNDNIDKWFSQNPDVSASIQQEEAVKKDTEEFWNFYESQTRRSQAKPGGRRR